MKELTHISLFAGIGGIDLAAEWAGFRTILFVEIDPFCQRVLRRHWPDVLIIGDIRDATKEKIMAYTEGRNSGKQEAWNGGQGVGGGSQEGSRRRGAPISPVTLITGGFPCQPVSQAGKRRGKDDDRWLWPEMLRVISEVRPTWVVAENVAGLLHLGFYDCLSDLEGEGYETISFVIPACGVNAPHRRDRIFIVAHDGRVRCELRRPEGKRIYWEDKTRDEADTGGKDVADTEQQRQIQCSSGGNGEQTRHRKGVFEGGGETDANSQGEGLEGANAEGAAQTQGCPTECLGCNWWATESDVGRVAHGIPNRVDRLKCLGNAVVPQQIYPILQAIADIENDGSIL